MAEAFGRLQRREGARAGLSACTTDASNGAVLLAVLDVEGQAPRHGWRQLPERTTSLDGTVVVGKARADKHRIMIQRRRDAAVRKPQRRR